MLFRWMRSRREALDLAESLERENEGLRATVQSLKDRNTRLFQLVRLLRDVNVDLDTKLLEATHGQG
jgi:cell division protein FtsB